MQATGHHPCRLVLTTGLLLFALAPGLQAKPGNGKGGPGGNGDADPAPDLYLAFESTRSAVEPGQAVVLSWASTGTRHCFASGGWEGKFAPDGFYATAPLSITSAFTLECKNGRDSVTASVTVEVVQPNDPTPTDPQPTPEPDPEPEPEPQPSAPPQVILSAADTSVISGSATRLFWSSTDATSCSASNGWSGTLAASGEAASAALLQDTTFDLTCSGPGGSASASVTVAVESALPPEVELRAADAVIDSGLTTQLNWTTTNADACSASGAWSGPRPTSGSETTVALTAQSTFTLSCGGAGGSAVAMVSVSINGAVTIAWEPPSSNVDGSPLTDLGGYRLYYGSSSGAYTASVGIEAPDTSHSLTLPSGDYYFAMTAIDADGNESAYSNEVLRSIN